MQSTAIISPDMTDEMRSSLKAHNIEPVILPGTDRIAVPVSGHPDMQIFIHADTLFCHPDIDSSFLKKVDSRINIVQCGTRLSSTYPGDIPYNIACTGGAAFHRTDATEPFIRKYLNDSSVELVHVRQGYSRCSSCIISPEALITADRGIHQKAMEHGLASLLIEPGHVALPGYRYGLIGGASGMTGDTVFFTGTVRGHPDYLRIMEFIENSGKGVVFLSDDPAIDLGSILIF